MHSPRSMIVSFNHDSGENSRVQYILKGMTFPKSSLS